MTEIYQHPRKGKPRTWSTAPLPFGTVRLRKTSAGNESRLVKVPAKNAKGYRWIQWARWWWEQNKGPVPRGMRVGHRDGDLLNDDPTNLVLCSPGDILSIVHTVYPRVAEKNRKAAAKATARANRDRGNVRRALGWIPGLWYPLFPESGVIVNAPAKKRHQVIGQFGIADPASRHAAKAMLGFPDCDSQIDAAVLRLLLAGPQTSLELRSSLFDLYELAGWQLALGNSSLYIALARLRSAGLIEGQRRELRYITPFGIDARGRKRAVLVVRGDRAEQLVAEGKFQRIDRLEGECRLCGCTEQDACLDDVGPCWWIDQDLCSHCHTEISL